MCNFSKNHEQSFLFQRIQTEKQYRPVLYPCGSMMHTRTSHFFISSRSTSLYISIPDFDTAYAPKCSSAARPAHGIILSKMS